MYKVFFNDKVVFFTDDINSSKIERKAIFFCYSGEKSLRDFISRFRNANYVNEAWIYFNDIDVLKDKFKLLFEYQEGAGGLVINEEDKILFIKKYSKWDLPKGHIEEGETFEQTAIREVIEECGLKGELEIEYPLHNTYHVFTKDNKDILKKTYWFNMQYKGDSMVTPQVIEGIDFVKWFDKNKLQDVIENTYLSIIDVLILGNIISK